MFKDGYRLKGTVESKYSQIVTGVRFNITRWGKTGFFARGLLKPTWKTSSATDATEEYRGFFSSSADYGPRKTDREINTPNFIVFVKPSAGLTTFFTDNFQGNLEIGVETQVASSGSFEGSTNFGPVGVAQGSLSVSF
jgi:hypothetical protein